MLKLVSKHQHLQKANTAENETDYYRLLTWYARFLAPIYNIFFLTLSLGEEPKLRERVAYVTGAGNGCSVLDVATGTGRQAVAFARNKSQVVAIDLSRDMIAKAKQKNEYENLTFEIADASNLPFKDDIFDISCVSFALHDMIISIREKALREMVRVTREKGNIVIIDYAVPESKVTRFFSNIFRFFEPYHSEFIRFDLETLMQESGIQIERKVPVLFGFGRLLMARVC